MSEVKTETYSTDVPEFESSNGKMKFKKMGKALVTVKCRKVCYGYKVPNLDYFVDSDGVRHPVMNPINPFEADVLEGDATWHKSIVSIEPIK